MVAFQSGPGVKGQSIAASFSQKIRRLFGPPEKPPLGHWCRQRRWWCFLVGRTMVIIAAHRTAGGAVQRPAVVG